MKCPFLLNNHDQTCDRNCALLVKCTNTNINNGKVVVGDVCGLAAISCNIPGVTFAPALIEVLDSFDICEVNDE